LELPVKRLDGARKDAIVGIQEIDGLRLGKTLENVFDGAIACAARTGVLANHHMDARMGSGIEQQLVERLMPRIAVDRDDNDDPAATQIRGKDGLYRLQGERRVP
jgi:hypothetical protein